MKAFVITIKNHTYSEQKAKRCIQTGKTVGRIDIERFDAINKDVAQQVMKEHNLKWTWAHNNTKQSVCPVTGLHQRPYYNANLNAKIGCSMSHYLLWNHCTELNETILILEHDSVFIKKFPSFEFKGICQINDPKGGGKNGKKLSERMIARGGRGVFPKTPNQKDPKIPDGLAGNSAYVIKPWAAEEAINKTREVGLWMNDALLCKQLFPYLEEYYPFITKVEQEISTSST